MLLKCRFCSYATEDFDDLQAHEKRCYKEVIEEEKKQRIDAKNVQLKILSDKRNDYINQASFVLKEFADLLTEQDKTLLSPPRVNQAPKTVFASTADYASWLL